MREIPLYDNNGSIRIKFKYLGQVYRLTPVKGGRYDNDLDMQRAKMVADRISLDIAEGKFDTTLSAYKSKSEETLKRLIVENKKDLDLIEREKKDGVDLCDLWVKYVNFKSKMLTATTINVDYRRRVDPALKKLPYKDVSKKEVVIKIRDWLLSYTTVDQTKRIIVQLSACCNWAVDSGLLETNYFSNLNSKIHLPKKDAEDDINPFTIEERNRIIHEFQHNRHYRHYYGLVAFLFKIGCRPSEALALTWDDVDFNNKTLTFNRVYVEGLVKEYLKTQRRRKIDNLNDDVLEILIDVRNTQKDKQAKTDAKKHNIHNLIISQQQHNENNNADKNKNKFKKTCENERIDNEHDFLIHYKKDNIPNNQTKDQNTQKDNLIFPSPRGGYIDWHNFTNRAWRKVLDSLPDIEYRNPYQTRHTFITLMVRNNVPIPDIARHCGNSSKVIFERYAAPNRDVIMPIV
jgi:integrase